jgi:hypothetical protein
MAHSVKRRFAKEIIRTGRLSNLILKLYPIAIENSLPGLTRSRVDELRQLFPLSINQDLELIRLGSLGDGGYLLHNDFSKTDYCLSLGIGDNFSFDLAISDKCKEVWMFDHTIDDPQIKDSNLKFHNVGIAATIQSKFTTMSKILEDIPKEHDIILKIDIEGSEWDVLKNLSSSNLIRCKQIVAEFHNLHKIADDHFFDLVSKSLSNLNNSHDLINLHVNNWSSLHLIQGVPVPDVIEVTYIRRKPNLQTIGRTISIQRTGDLPNNLDLPDYSSNFINSLKIY